jgi:acetyl esterase
MVKGTPRRGGSRVGERVTDEHDPLRDEGLAYAERLRDDDIEVTAHHYEDMMHVCFQFAIVFDRGI